MSQIVGDVHNFLDPPYDNGDYFEFGKNLKLDDPPSLGPKLEQI